MPHDYFETAKAITTQHAADVARLQRQEIAVVHLLFMNGRVLGVYRDGEAARRVAAHMRNGNVLKTAGWAEVKSDEWAYADIARIWIERRTVV